MKIRLSYLICFLATVFSFVWYSCKKENVVIPTLSYNYFPTEKGRYIVYDVDSIYHAENDNNNDDSVYFSHYQIKDRIDSSFHDLEGRINQVLLRYRREDTTMQWQLMNVWTQYLSASGAFVTEDNVRFHKLAFPINPTISWNGNDSNTGEEETYFYDYYHESDNIHGLSFDSTLSVVQVDENNYVEKIYGNEKYAAGVGLIFKERDDLGKKNGQVVKGIEYRMVITDYGVE